MTHPALAELAEPDDYDELPESRKQRFSRHEYGWLADGAKATLVQRVTFRSVRVRPAQIKGAYSPKAVRSTACR